MQLLQVPQKGEGDDLLELLQEVQVDSLVQREVECKLRVPARLGVEIPALERGQGPVERVECMVLVAF